VTLSRAGNVSAALKVQAQDQRDVPRRSAVGQRRAARCVRSAPFFLFCLLRRCVSPEYLQAAVVWKKSDSVKGSTPLVTLRHGAGSFSEQFFSFDATLFSGSAKEVS
jgi:hypothetical protein